jgi:2-polyprenyl-6-methoxyphenol hydroxylase-like FAD-dependent oxidoreductase
MNTGLVDACVLGRLIAHAVSGKQSESGLDRYQELRRPAKHTLAMNLSGLSRQRFAANR